MTKRCESTYLEKKPLSWAIITLFLGLVLVIYPVFVSATIPNDVHNIDFESGEGYSTGDLNGQNSWTGSTNVDISNTASYVRSGSQGVYQGSASADTMTFGNATLFNSSVGGIAWYNFSLKRTNTASGTGQIHFGNTTTGFGFGTSRIDNTYDIIYGVVALFTCDTKEYISSQSAPFPVASYDYYDPLGLSYNTWTDFAIKFDLDEKLIWLYYKQEGMSEYYNFSEVNNTCFWINSTREDSNFFEVFKIVNIYRYYAVDNFYNESADICTFGGSCSACETSEDCLNAGCIYEYNVGFDRWECHQEWIPYIPGCGTGFRESCYGCYTQETCESAIPTGVCEWVDRGYGVGCYPTEEVPPEAVWEEPEMENCEELSGVEKWLCEIKNWLAGIFMPTQEKVNEINSTINNFKTKFPFNYANSLSAFFNTIKTSFDSEKDIPIKVLGVESNVDFSFWDQNTTIGGIGETLKNVVFDFTTIFIVLSFFFWIISFIKRIF